MGTIHKCRNSVIRPSQKHFSGLANSGIDRPCGGWCIPHGLVSDLLFSKVATPISESAIVISSALRAATRCDIVELDLFDRRRPHRAFYRCVSLACAANHQLVPCYCVHCACSRPLRSNLALARGHQNAKIFQRLAAPERGRRSSEGRREEGNHLYGVMLCMLKHDPLIACRMNNAERLNQQCVC